MLKRGKNPYFSRDNSIFIKLKDEENLTVINLKNFQI